MILKNTLTSKSYILLIGGIFSVLDTLWFRHDIKADNDGTKKLINRILDDTLFNKSGPFNVPVSVVEGIVSDAKNLYLFEVAKVIRNEVKGGREAVEYWEKFMNLDTNTDILLNSYHETLVKQNL